MSLLSQIATASAVTAAPSAKFVGRPAIACRKCKSIRHWVNTMGGIQCLSCNPPPSSLTESDIASRALIVSSGIWEQDDGTNSQNSPVAPQSTISTKNDTYDYSKVFVDCDATGAVLRHLDGPHEGQFIFQDPFPAWLPDEIALVNWFLDLTATNSDGTPSASFTRLASRLQNQRISRWEVVLDANRYLTDFRSRCAEGPSNPANCYGGLICDLRRLWIWITENDADKPQAGSPSRSPAKQQPQTQQPSKLQPINLAGLNLLSGLKIKL